MAYTYEQFETAASKAGLLNKFSKQDLTIAQSNPEYGISMLQLMKDRNGAKTSEQRLLANEAVRQLRKTYGGYTSAGRLPEYTDEVIQQTDNYYAGQNAYRRALAEAEGYSSTTYDKKLGDIYTRQSALDRDRAKADALATASAATGGRPSSYAITAAQQAAGNQDAQLDEVIQGLRQNAYQQALNAASKSIMSANKPNTKTESEEPLDDNTIKNTGKTFADAVREVVDKVKTDALDRPTTEDTKDNAVGTTTKEPSQLNTPTAVETDAVKTLIESIDGNVSVLKKTGASKAEIQNYILGVLNNDIRTGSFSDGEFAWLVNYYGLV